MYIFFDCPDPVEVWATPTDVVAFHTTWGWQIHAILKRSLSLSRKNWVGLHPADLGWNISRIEYVWKDLREITNWSGVFSIRVEPVLCVSEDACKGASSSSISSFMKLVLQENLSSLIRNPSFFACVSLLRKTIGSVYPEGLVRTSKWRVWNFDDLIECAMLMFECCYKIEYFSFVYCCSHNQIRVN